jgi:biopolymer transport protein ExbD
MAGVDFGSGTRGGRRSLDSEINMIPMIDLLIVTISFLLITAVWTHMARINADALVPGHGEIARPIAPEKWLHVDMRRSDRFVLTWKQGNVAVDSFEVPRTDVAGPAGSAGVTRFPDLAARLEQEWKTRGQHTSPADANVDQVVLHTDNQTEFERIVAALDAIYATHRLRTHGVRMDRIPAFNVTFAID